MLSLALACSCGSDSSGPDLGPDTGLGNSDSGLADSGQALDGAVEEAGIDGGVVSIAEGNVSAPECRTTCQALGFLCTDAYDWFSGLGQFGGSEATYGLCKMYLNCADPVELQMDGCGPLTRVRCACVE